MKQKFPIMYSVVARNQIKRTKNYINSLPLNLFSHLVSNKHEKKHRFVYGITVAIVGVVIAKTGGHCEVIIIQYVSDFTGYLLHGVGLIPIIDHCAESVKESMKQG